MKKCYRCQRRRHVKHFAFARKATGKLQSWCRDCRRVFDKERYDSSEEQKRIRRKNDVIKHRNAKFLCDYLLEHPCVDCGEDDPIVLDFDHVKSVKSFNVSEGALLRGLGLKKLAIEISKCEVRCANCHRRRTASLTKNHKKLLYLKSLGVG